MSRSGYARRPPSPPHNESPEAVALRQAAIAFGRNVGEPVNDQHDSESLRLNAALMRAAFEYAVALVVEHKFNWCRARFMHAIAGASETGLLVHALEEIMPFESLNMGADELACHVNNALHENRWMKRPER